IDVELIPDDVPADRSFLMDMYARSAEAYMEESGATERDFAAVVVKNQANGALNPKAQYGQTLTIEDVLNARRIVGPFTLPMCSPISDGAAAAVLASEEALSRGGVRVRVLASAVRSADLASPGLGVTARAAEAAYEMAGLGPEDVEVAEVHDAAASAELVIYEQLGLAPLGAGAA